jgi:hypothetical protein
MSYLVNLLGRDWLPEWFLQPATATVASEKNYRPQNAHDVYHMAFNLRQVLVPDLVPVILDLAEYWTKTSYDRQDPKSYVEHTSGRPYLIAAVSQGLGPRMVRKVEISITSHDQGWSSYPQYHGTYEASWTWFEAEIHLTGENAQNCVKRTLCANVHAEAKDKTHMITWRYDAEDNEESSLLRSLGTESIISVVPWARFPGWKNHVSCAGVDIYTAGVRRL